MTARGGPGVPDFCSGDALARLAREAFLRFGEGRHPAGLNVGDRFGDALARTLDAPPLFVGDDFARADVRAALETRE